MPIKDVYQMTWAEFQLRSFGFWEDRKFKMQMTREIAYEVHVGHYVFGKKKPPKKSKYWNIEGKKSKRVEESHKEAFLKELKKYNKEKNG